MLDVRKPAIRPFALEGKFGLEREALRVTEDKRMAQTPHPFPQNGSLPRKKSAATAASKPLQFPFRPCTPSWQIRKMRSSQEFSRDKDIC